MNQEQSAAIILNQSKVARQSVEAETSEKKRTGISPLKVVFLAGLGLFGLITLLIISWPLVAWIGSLRVG